MVYTARAFSENNTHKMEDWNTTTRIKNAGVHADDDIWV
jgi:hypothetical protein